MFDVIFIEESDNFRFSYNSFVKVDDVFKHNNGIIKAYKWLSSQFLLPNVFIHLEKNIPIKAGLGGGSSDVAAFLFKMCEIFDINPMKLINNIGELGSDVIVCFLYHLHKHPLFFIDGTGKDIVKKIHSIPQILLKPTLLTNPNIHLSTKEIFEGFKDFQPHPDNMENSLINGQNVLTKNAIKKAPVIKEIIENSRGSLTSRMSGSGSTCFSIYKKMQDAYIIKDMWNKWVEICFKQ